MHCAVCNNKQCYQEGKDCTGKREEIAKHYHEEHSKKIMQASAEVEAEGYANLTRVQELVLFAQKMGYTRLGIAFCIGCAEEARALSEILEPQFSLETVCCKVCGIDKAAFGLKTIRGNVRETVCNPAGQAQVLNDAQTDLNIIIGLCLGHDIVFTQHSRAPVTTLVVKDRVLANNPAAVFYSPYWKYKLKVGVK